MRLRRRDCQSESKLRSRLFFTRVGACILLLSLEAASCHITALCSRLSWHMDGSKSIGSTYPIGRNQSPEARCCWRIVSIFWFAGPPLFSLSSLYVHQRPSLLCVPKNVGFSTTKDRCATNTWTYCDLKAIGIPLPSAPKTEALTSACNHGTSYVNSSGLL